MATDVRKCMLLGGKIFARPQFQRIRMTQLINVHADLFVQTCSDGQAPGIDVKKVAMLANSPK